MTVGSVKLSTKPTDSSQLFYENRKALVSATSKEISVEVFARKVGDEGYSFLLCNHEPINGGSCKFKINNSTAIDFQIFALDFDADQKIQDQLFTPSKALERLREYGLDATFIYRTFSDDSDSINFMEDCQKFRIVIALEEVVIINKIGGVDTFRSYYQNFFHQIFPEADNKVKDPSRFFYGGKGLIYENLNFRLDLKYFNSIFDDFQCSSIKSKRRRDDFRKSTIESRYKNSEMSSQPNRFIWADERWEYARREWKYLDDFLSCRIKPLHDELYKLYIAMDEIQGGAKKWLNAVKNNPAINYEEKKIKIADWVKRSKRFGEIFNEPSIGSIDPSYSGVYKRLTLVTQESAISMQPARRIENYTINERSWIEVNEDTTNIINSFFSKNNQKILVKAQTGSGKTTAILTGLKEVQNSYKTVMAFPRHDIKEEISKLLSKEKIYHLVLPQEPSLPENLNIKIKELREYGFFEKAAKILRGLASMDEDLIEEFNIIDDDFLTELGDFYSEIENCLNSSILLLTTHESLLRYNFHNYERVIIDEDPTNSFLKTYKINVNPIQNLIRRLSKKSKVRAYLSSLLNYCYLADYRTVEPNPLINILKPTDFSDADNKILSTSKIKNIAQLFRADEIIGINNGPNNTLDAIGFGIAEKLKTDFHSILITSATPIIPVIENYFRGITVVDLGLIKPKGKFYQFCKRSITKGELIFNDTKEVIEKIADSYPEIPIISHKSPIIDKIFKNNLNFHNNSGTNELYGKNLLVLGTEYTPEFQHIITCKLLDLKIESTCAEWQMIERNGWKFPFRTFKDSVLKELHLSKVESILIQAAGRSRIEQTEAIVLMLNKFPHPQSEQINCKFSDLPELILKIL